MSVSKPLRPPSLCIKDFSVTTALTGRPGFVKAPYPVTLIAGRSGQLLDTLDFNLKVTLGHLVTPSVLLFPLNFPVTHQLRLIHNTKSRSVGRQ